MTIDTVTSFHLIYTALTYLLTGTRLSDHISPVLRELHCQVQSGLPGSPVAVRAGASLLGRGVPGLVSASTRRSLRSADVSTCVLPPTLSSYGDRTFAAAGPLLWNSLPVQLRNPDITYGLFRRQLKGHLSPGSMNTALCDF